MCSTIPDGTYEIKIGETFIKESNKSSKAEFNTLRYDFKPASITDGSDAFLAIASGENNGVQVIVPGEAKKPTIFHGSKKPLKGDKECLLIFDQNTGALRLERISANINVKKSRDAKLPTCVEEQVEQMMKLKAPPPPPSPIKIEEIKKERLFSTSSTSMNGDDDNEDMSDVEDELEQMMVSKPTNSQSSMAEPTLSSSIKMEAMSPQKLIQQKEPTKKLISPSKSKKGDEKSILHDDLELSESSNESSFEESD